MIERAPPREPGLEALREKVTELRGRQYWSHLAELAAMPEFPGQSREAHPAFAATAADFDRRRFLQLAAASMALLGVAACGPEVEPRNRQSYVDQPPGMVPGRARYYATATSLDGYGSGVLIEHQMGRPIKVEGNPDHPASLGATSAIGQASILSLYDPYRAQALTHQGAIATWEGLATAVLGRRPELLARKGENLALLTGPVTSPTLVAQIADLRASYPALRRFQWAAVDRDAARAGAEMAFGRPVDAVPMFAAADVVVAVGGDFLDSAPGHLRFAREFASRRGAAEMRERMSRLYALESTPTLAGAKADHRLIISPAEIERALRRLAGTLGVGPAEWASLDHPHARTLDAIAMELLRAQGQALVHVGSAEDSVVHALAHAVNQAIGAVGRTVRFIEPVVVAPEGPAPSLAALTDAMLRGEIDTLVIIGAVNPAFAAPADLEFTRALAQVPLSIYLGQYADETAAAVTWHVPEAHDYEAWSDIRAFDGTATILQPQIRTQADRRSAHELLALLGGEDRPDGHAIVRSHWQASANALGVGGFDSFWTEALRVGVVPQTAAQAVNVTVRPDFVRSLAPPAGAETGITVLFRQDPFLWDGRFADNGWLQELGRPFTRLTWDNAALVSPRTAQRSGLVSGDIVAIELGGRRIRAPIWVLPGQADGCVTLPLGFGRRVCGPVGEGTGFDAYPLRTRESLWRATGASIRGTGERYAFATVQGEALADGRDLVHEGTLAQFLKDPEFLRSEAPTQSLYAAFRDEGIAWAMSINLNACIGCQACVAACQAENNSPVVGKTEVSRGREMHWLRIDRYYSGSADDPATLFQPVPCMQCEDAPCEVVCPVHATVHDSEGLNVMVYNRCVGTRFCSNNCPYKVRRFNFFDYTHSDPRPRESWNPEVTVRARGVMEKCTYCIQRTRAAMIDADRENRRVRDGEVITACQQVCPTRAITFGDRNDSQSAVAKRKASPLDYVMLASLNTRPRTSYEALIRNPNPGLGDG
jgi:molybdopterin-containing oxidoreductase family iron-sulfur binding subunit